MLRDFCDHALFDPGASHYFLKSEIVPMLVLPYVVIYHRFAISTPIEDVVGVGRICKCCAVYIGKTRTEADLIIFNMQDFDVILGMVWLQKYHDTYL